MVAKAPKLVLLFPIKKGGQKRQERLIESPTGTEDHLHESENGADLFEGLEPTWDGLRVCVNQVLLESLGGQVIDDCGVQNGFFGGNFGHGRRQQVRRRSRCRCRC